MAAHYERLCGTHIVDLLWHLPSSCIDRRYTPQLKQAERDRIATLTLTIEEHVAPRKPSLPYRIIASDDATQIEITYFNAKGDYLSKLYPTGKQVVVSGRLEKYQGHWTMSHPDYVVPQERADEIPKLEPIYPLTEGLGGKMMRKTISAALAKVPELPEWLDTHLVTREKWPTWKQALLLAHNPELAEKAGGDALARKRLAYDELLADQLALAVIREHNRKVNGRAMPGNGKLQKHLSENLPFDLTEGQCKALAEISADMAVPKRMMRLLQGDVGAGKTIVALFAMLQAVESGAQTAMMAPTEILARQHYERLSQFLAPLGIEVGLLIGKSRNKERQTTLGKLADGSLKIVVGTHALFQSDIAFKDLGFAVIDEQHRFGVQQRLQLSDKGKGVDILVMTATPIPRTLTLTAFGDMDVSRLTDKPAGRQPIDTRLIDLKRLEEVSAGIHRQTELGAQVYWVCPLVEESEKSDLAAATERAESLRKKYGAYAVGLIHGRMTPDEKDKVMQAFTTGEIKVLVATTVIEVGVDVKRATIMVVEHAERFGLAQLHQLRGRVGRGEAKSTCLLLYQAPLSETAKARLSMLRDTEDGFQIAEEDLRLRGPGELLGTRQSGVPDFRLANLITDHALIAIAHDDAQLILNRDAALASPRGEALRTLLYLFKKDAAVPLFRA